MMAMPAIHREAVRRLLILTGVIRSLPFCWTKRPRILVHSVYAEAAPGAIGIETMLPAALRLVQNGDMKLMTALKALSTRPAELLGLPGGTLRPGSPADVVVIDPDVPWILDRDELKSKCRNTPFDEARMQGRAVRTIVGGRTVYEFV